MSAATDVRTKPVEPPAAAQVIRDAVTVWEAAMMVADEDHCAVTRDGLGTMTVGKFDGVGLCLVVSHPDEDLLKQVCAAMNASGAVTECMVLDKASGRYDVIVYLDGRTPNKSVAGSDYP